MHESTPRLLLFGASLAVSLAGLIVAMIACCIVVMEFLLFDPASVGEPMVPETVSAFRLRVAVHAALSGLGLLASYALLGWTLRRLLREPRQSVVANDHHG